jgi:hypothetical protein
VGPEVKHGLFPVARRARNPKKLPPEGWGPLNKGCERRTWALPDVSGGGERGKHVCRRIQGLCLRKPAADKNSKAYYEAGMAPIMLASATEAHQMPVECGWFRNNPPVSQ